MFINVCGNSHGFVRFPNFYRLWAVSKGRYKLIELTLHQRSAKTLIVLCGTVVTFVLILKNNIPLIRKKKG